MPVELPGEIISMIFHEAVMISYYDDKAYLNNQSKLVTAETNLHTKKSIRRIKAERPSRKLLLNLRLVSKKMKAEVARIHWIRTARHPVRKELEQCLIDLDLAWRMNEWQWQFKDERAKRLERLGAPLE